MRFLGRAARSACHLLLLAESGVLGMCAGVSSAYPGPRTLRLQAVLGQEAGKCNDILFCHAQEEEGQRPQHVIYFPGDVQNYRDVMASHSENFRWKRWSLEDTAVILSRRFPSSHIWIVKPSRMHLHKFSCYDHFVESNMFGAPKHSAELIAFRQLLSLLVNAFPVAHNILMSQSNKYAVGRGYDILTCDASSSHDENGCDVGKDIKMFSENSAIHFGLPTIRDSASFTVIGFSKGCVVLNQLLHELQEAQKDKEVSSFLANLEAMYWLDGGHSGGSETWITHPNILKAFSQTGIAVHTHVTPYQVSDSMRSWIGEEHKKFVQILKEYSVTVDNRLHFMYEMPSLDNHFRVHEVF